MRRVTDPGDARVRRVEMARGGTAAVEAGRASRTRIVADLTQVLGTTAILRLRRDLERVLAALGDIDVLTGRRLHPPQ